MGGGSWQVIFLQCKLFCYRLGSLTCPIKKNCIGLYLENTKGHNSLLIIVSPKKTLSNNPQNCWQCELLHCLAGKRHSFSPSDRYSKVVSQCNFLIWIYSGIIHFYITLTRKLNMKKGNRIKHLFSEDRYLHHETYFGFELRDKWWRFI